MNWIKYDRNSTEIESHVVHLTTDGLNIWMLQHAKYVNASGYGWHEGRIPVFLPITHWARITLPQAIDPTESPSTEGTAAEEEVYGNDCRNGQC